MKAYTTVKTKEEHGVFTLVINRPAANNSINSILINEMQDIFNTIEKDDSLKVVVLAGNKSVFCTGMDFNAVNSGSPDAMVTNDPNGYYNLLKSITSCSKIVISLVEGKVNAGGMGLVAASDIVIANAQATFGLSEALFGLLPACVMPFLIRRIGFQKAQWMTLVTQGINTKRAFEIGLVDEMGENTQDILRRNLLRLTRLETNTIFDLKNYMAKLWILNDETQKLAVDKITTLVSSDKVKSNIKNFVERGVFPWSK